MEALPITRVHILPTIAISLYVNHDYTTFCISSVYYTLITFDQPAYCVLKVYSY